MLALDLALNSGWTFWAQGDAKPRAGLLEIDRKKNLGGRLAQVFKFAFPFCKENGVTDISIEEPMVGGPGNNDQFFWLISAYGVVCMLAEQIRTNGVPINVTPIANATMATHWLGTKTIEKADRKTYSILEAQRRGLGRAIEVEIKGEIKAIHDIADSFGVLSTRCAQLSICNETPWDSKRSPGPLFTGHAQGHKTPLGTRITAENKRTAAIITNRVLHPKEKG